MLHSCGITDGQYVWITEASSPSGPLAQTQRNTESVQHLTTCFTPDDGSAPRKVPGSSFKKILCALRPRAPALHIGRQKQPQTSINRAMTLRACTYTDYSQSESQKQKRLKSSLILLCIQEEPKGTQAKIRSEQAV